MVSIERLRQGRSRHALDGNLEEIGEWSALILTQEAVSAGTTILVKGKDQELKGRVRSCSFDGLLGFFLEIELDPESRWSEKWFTPEHLFALCPTMRYFTEKMPKVPEKCFPEKVAHA
jgi:hypothetical protein